jgi:hypothetical protein
MTWEAELHGSPVQVAGTQPLVLRVTDGEFQHEVLEKLGQLEAMMHMLVGNGQPGRVKLAEDRIAALERADVRRTVYDRMMSAVIATLISAAIALHDHLVIR